jgi:outer membrane protein assembly factor BamD (BamD/ComL family)
MTPRKAVFLLTLLVCAGGIAVAHADEKPKEQAKDLADKAKGEGNDRVKQVQDFCSAAQLDPKEKKFADLCSSYRSGLIQDDTAMLASAIAAYKSNDLNRAESQAKLVSSYDQKLSGQARFVLDLVRNQRVVYQIQADWKSGDLDAILSLSQVLTNADAKAAVAVYVNNVNTYKGYMNQAQSQAQSNPDEAIRQLTLAKTLNPNGPGNPAGMIADLQNAIHAKNTPPPTQTPKMPANSAGDTQKKVAKLLNDAHEAEKQGKQQDALSDYAMVLKLQPGNSEAQSSMDRIQLAIQNDPAAAKNELKTAIRYFYNSQFDDARRALMNYLESPQTAKNPGVADFYLGATLIERSMLQTPRAQWKGPTPDALTAFQEARKANYQPMRDYVSPALLKIWDSTSQ